MKASQSFLATLKEAPSDAEVVSHKLMVRAGLIRKLSAGIYNYLPLGLKVIRRVENIIREEMNRAGAIELLMPMIQPAELWQETGRWEKMGPELLRIKDRHDRDFLIQPTSEEVITDLARNEIKSYKQLPVNFYQIQTKFRDERRPRFGIMRGRELMLLVRGDHELNEVKASKVPGMGQSRFATEAEIKQACNAPAGYLGPVGVSADVTVVADRTVANMSDFVCGANDVGHHLTGVNWGRDLPEPLVLDIRNAVMGDPSPDGKGAVDICRGIEVGHVFQLGTRYSEAMGCTYLDQQGKAQPMVMGCYGIGVTRLLGAAIEQGHDERGIIWPISMAPFEVVICPMGYDKSEAVKAACDQLHNELLAAGIDVILDDRNERPGAMFADWELIGVPFRVVIGDRGLADSQVEFKGRTDTESQNIPLADIKAKVITAVQTAKKLVS